METRDVNARPADHMYIVIDCADQKSFTRHHFNISVKDNREHGLKAHMKFMPHHEIFNHLHLYLLTREHKSGSNHIVQVLHLVMNKKGRQRTLARKLLLQLYKWVCANKKPFLLICLDFFVIWGVFDVGLISFLTTGHTHVYIDQTFSMIAEKRRRSDERTMDDMSSVLSICYNSSERV